LSTYRGTAERPDQAKAIGAVVAVHVALAFVILTGLNVRSVSQAVETLKTFNLREQRPPPPKPPPPTKPRSQGSMKKPEGAPAKRAEPTPVAAPPPRVPMPSPLPAAKIVGTGSATSSGAAAAGNGTGAGGNGNGPGGGGTGDYSRFTPAQLIRNLSRGDYRSIAQGRMPTGRAMVSLRVETNGAATNCRVVRSSGDPWVDGSLCPLIEARLRFRPALDDQGRPIPYQLQYVATWRF
jgi:protein TonB